MPFFGDTGTQYNQETADQLTQALQGDPWRQQAQQRKAAIQARGGQWAPDDYQFFGVDPSRMDQHWKDKYLNNIDQMAAQGIAQKSGQNFNTGIYNIEDGKVGQRTSFVDSPLGKALVLAPMIAGGGLAAAGALGGAAGGAVPSAAGSAPALAPAGDLAGLGGAGAVSAGGGLAGAGEAGGLAGLGTASAVGPGGGLGAVGDITGELGASTGTATGGVPQALGATSQAATGFGAAGSKWLPTLFNTGMQLGGAALGSHAAGKAADQQAAQVQNALNLQKDLYGQSRQALMPYYQLGAGSLGRLGAFLGTKPAAAIPDGTLGSLGK